MEISKTTPRLAKAGLAVLVAALALWAAPATASARHLSGGESDLLGLYGAIALVLGFSGLLGILGLLPKRWRWYGYRYGRWLLAAGVLVLLGGGYHASAVGAVEESVGDEAWGRLASQQLLGTLGVFLLFWGGVYYFSRRAGVLNMGESVKYAIFRNGDPPDWTAWRRDQPGERRLVWVPVAAMGGLAAFFAVGVLVAMIQVGSWH